MKKLLIPVLLLALLLCFTACSRNTIQPVLSTTPSPEADASPSPEESDASEPTPTPLPEYEPDLAVPEVSDAGFDELYKASSFVFLGTVDDDGEEWNSVRDVNDLSKPNATVFEMDMSFKFTLKEVLKGDDQVKVGDTIQYNLHYRDKYPGDNDYTMDENYFAPVKGSTYLVFLERDPDDTGVLSNYYYVAADPHCFELRSDNKLYIYTNLTKDGKSLADTWGNGQGKTGVAYASAKQEMNVK